MRLIGRRLKSINVAAGADEVFSAYPLSAGGQLHSVQLECHLLSTTLTSYNTASMYGMDGFVVPVLDADAAVNLNTMWDQQVPKDVAYSNGVFDLDTGAADATPVFELGEPDWTEVFDMATLEPREIFKRRRMLSFSSGQGHATYDRAAGNYYPMETFKTIIKRGVRTAFPSYVMFGLSSPSLDQTTATEETALTEVQWSQYQFLEETLRQAFIALIGLVELGAETPWEEAAAFVAKLIEDTAFEEVSNTLAETTWQCICRSTYDVSVPGTLTLQTLSSD